MKIVLLLLLSITCFAQDPFVAAPTVKPFNLYPGQSATVTVSFGNASTNPISVDDANHLVYTVTLFPYARLRETGFSLAVPTGATYTPDNLTVTADTLYIPFNPSSGNLAGTATRFTIKQKDISIPMPAKATYNLTISIVAIGQLYIGSYVSDAVSSTGITTNDPVNDNGYNNTISITGNDPLPVSLVSFTAKAQSDRTIELAWTTSWETDNKGFLMERSKDLKAFEKVGEVADVAAISNSQKHYSLTDQFPYPGTSYYRLTQLDLGGKTTTFPAVSVVLREGTYGVFPNPTLSGQPFRVSLDEPETANVNLYSADGRAVSCHKAGIESGSLLLKMPDKLADGVYILTVEERGQTRRHRLIVK